MVRALALSFCFALLALVVAVTPARAATDVVRDLDVTFDVRADGTVGVTYVLDWDFGETGRHGINFGIATRESWDQDTSLDAVYGVTNLEVSSPTGAPAVFDSAEENHGSDSSLNLRIGDPGVTLGQSRHTYVISYDLTGALRTFDDLPELHWDITSLDYPEIEQFRITVNAPEGVERGLCFVGSDDCAAEVADGVGTFSGSKALPGEIITIAAGLPAGSVENAEPDLRPRRVTHQELTEANSHVSVTADGVAHVEQTWTYVLPDEGDQKRFFASFYLPVRAPHDKTNDRLHTIEGLSATLNGDPLHVDAELTDNPARRQELDITLRERPDASPAEVVFSYTLSGAVDPDASDSQARFTWQASDELLGTNAPASWQWEFPGEVSEVCRRLPNVPVADADCTIDDIAVIDGNTVTITMAVGDGAKRFNSMNLLEVYFDASSLNSDVELALTQNLEAVHQRNSWLGAGLVPLVAGLAVLAFRYGSRFTLAKDTRYAGVAPGLVSTDRSVEESRRPRKPVVQFNPPDTDLATAGLLLDNRFHARHTAAVLTQLAVDGVVKIQSTPLSIRVGDERPRDPLAHKMRAVVMKYEPIRTSNSAAVLALNKEIHHLQGSLEMDRRTSAGSPPLRLRSSVPCWSSSRWQYW